MRIIVGILIVNLIVQTVTGQELINGSMPFQSDDSKDYSLFIPSTYAQGEAIAAYVALHPLNPNRWNAQTWCEELSEFAEANDLILICPDGGADGAIDDAIDTAFTSLILDSALVWYDIDPDQVYLTGFSWGGKTTYTYGLSHIDRFAGLMPIGAAISISEVDGISSNAASIPFYMIHGAFDSPATRLYPLIEAMESHGACVKSNLLQGVGHTIDFANQLQILSEGYDYLKSNRECMSTITYDMNVEQRHILSRNLLRQGAAISLIDMTKTYRIVSMAGQSIVAEVRHGDPINLPMGAYVITDGILSERMLIF